MADGSSKFASIWLNEEWYNEKLNTSSSQQYNSNLEAILATFLPKIDGKDKSLAVFLTSLPELPLSVITMLESLCVDPERSIVGFLALRDLVETRPPVRQPALNALLELCTHDDRKIRVLAISTVRRWVPGSAMSNQVVDYAKGVLRRLAKASQTEGEDVDMKPALGEENEQTVSTRFLKSVSPETVQQHVELFLALSRRHQPLLDQIFQLFPRLTPAMQDALEPLFTPLIQSLGASEKLLDILKHFPIGADRLALRVVSVLSDEGRKEVVGVVKGLMVERELDPRFIIPIIGQLDKVSYGVTIVRVPIADCQGEIVGQVPRIVSLLADNDNRDLVRTAFASALQKMTPADLLVSLHNEETALKQTIEGEPCVMLCVRIGLTSSHRFMLLNDHRLPFRRPRHRHVTNSRPPLITNSLHPNYHPGRLDIQITHPFRRQSHLPQADRQEDMGEPTAVGWLCPTRSAHQSCVLWCAHAGPEGMAERSGRQATCHQRRVEGFLGG